MIPPPDVLAARLERARVLPGSLQLDALVVTHLPNVFYLTGFAGSAGTVVLSGTGLSILVDGRYREALADRVFENHDGLRVKVVPPGGGSAEESLLAMLAEAGHGRVGFEAAHLSVARHQALERLISSKSALELLPTEGLVESLRLRKDPYEQATLREAGRRLSAIMQGVLADLGPGMREWDVAARLEAGLRRAGFARSAFDTIVASGANSAMPHHRAAERCLTPGDLVVLDFGGVYNGYCVDLSRTVSIGEPTAEAVQLHTAVSRAQAAAIAAVRPGARASDVDRAARDVLTEHGLGDAFTHGTGHGLGLEVHEAPRLGPLRTTGAEPTRDSTEILDAGMVVTIEPGAYLAGSGGVRIEDDVLVTSNGCEVLTTAGRELMVVDC
jgi:Xaa-Pro aminopeptidase